MFRLRLDYTPTASKRRASCGLVAQAQLRLMMAAEIYICILSGLLNSRNHCLHLGILLSDLLGELVPFAFQLMQVLLVVSTRALVLYVVTHGTTIAGSPASSSPAIVFNNFGHENEYHRERTAKDDCDRYEQIVIVCLLAHQVNQRDGTRYEAHDCHIVDAHTNQFGII